MTGRALLATSLLLAVACGDDAAEPPASADVVEVARVELPPVPGGERTPVTVDPARAEGTLEPRYLGVAFDTAQLSGGMWWQAGSDERMPAALPDLESDKLRRLTSELAPLLIRVGGTDCDAAYFCPEPGPCELPPSYQDAYIDDARLETTLQHEPIARVGDFAAAVGAEVLFCLSFGPGPRDAAGVWQPANARALIRYARGLPSGHVFTRWEPGNEINVLFAHFYLGYMLDAERLAADVATLRAVVDEEAPGGVLAAPGSFVSPFGEIPPLTAALLAEPGAAGLDAVSWHLYATQSSSCSVVENPADHEHLFDPEIQETHCGFGEDVAAAAGGRPVWNTESASAQCGGQQGVSDGMLDALWYADWLGVMARCGTSLVVRHSLVGADYSLLDPETFEPRPSFLMLVLMRRLAARLRLAAEVDRSRLLAHAYCPPAGDGLTVVVINHTAEERVAAIDAGGVTAARRWLLSTGGDLASRRATINGASPLPDGTIPEPPGEPVALEEGAAVLAVPARTIAFVTLELAAGAPPACR